MLDGKKVDAKNEDVDEKTCKKEFGFWILYIKIRLYGNFYENPRKKIWPIFFKTFLTNKGKNGDEDKKKNFKNELNF